uniref:RING-type domain-containing protein n=1 Tax=viral metagenome TaxID=1070528 RepID=A0A6C0LZC8_9ZZZZ
MGASISKRHTCKCGNVFDTPDAFEQHVRSATKTLHNYTGKVHSYERIVYPDDPTRFVTYEGHVLNGKAHGHGMVFSSLVTNPYSESGRVLVETRNPIVSGTWHEGTLVTGKLWFVKIGKSNTRGTTKDVSLISKGELSLLEYMYTTHEIVSVMANVGNYELVGDVMVKVGKYPYIQLHFEADGTIAKGEYSVELPNGNTCHYEIVDTKTSLIGNTIKVYSGTSVIYEGEHSNFVYDGVGVLYLPSGSEVHRGVFRDGVPVHVDDTVDCSVCYEKPRSVVFMPCKHLIVCSSCSEKISQCPMCRTDIADKIGVYM